MSFFAWLALAYFQSQSPIRWSSLVSPPVNVSSPSSSTGSKMKRVLSASEVPAKTSSKSSVAVVSALPSSSNRFSSCTARAEFGEASEPYWSMIESTKRTSHDRVIPLRVRSVIDHACSRDLMMLFLSPTRSGDSQPSCDAFAGVRDPGQPPLPISVGGLRIASGWLVLVHPGRPMSAEETYPPQDRQRYCS